MKIILSILGFFILMLFPFYVMIWVAVWFSTFGYGHYMFGFIIGASVALAYIIGIRWFILKKFYPKSKHEFEGLVLFKSFAFVLIVFLWYGILDWTQLPHYRVNIKNELNDLHPVLRLAVGALARIEPDIIITDLSRNPMDYRQMGLKVNRNSRHYIQIDGYSHAIDLNTSENTFLKNFMIKNYFNALGFHTLRHTGTGDHLHVELPLK
ncbi:MAG: hypothetical protein KDC16_09420 [Saprospiraceae bacterium]|nr:hypothetical protein [Saprospiraceae bacterium]MCB9328336.1 hypothetical protein [Lewinellaceae bacterium]